MTICAPIIGDINTVSASFDSFQEYCLYCLIKLMEEDRYDVLKSEDQTAYSCLQCLDEHKSEQAQIARIILNRFLDDYELDILADDADYSDDPLTAKYTDCFYLDISSELYSASEVIQVAASLIGCIQVGRRSCRRNADPMP